MYSKRRKRLECDIVEVGLDVNSKSEFGNVTDRANRASENNHRSGVRHTNLRTSSKPRATHSDESFNNHKGGIKSWLESSWAVTPMNRS